MADFIRIYMGESASPLPSPSASLSSSPTATEGSILTSPHPASSGGGGTTPAVSPNAPTRQRSYVTERVSNTTTCKDIVEQIMKKRGISLQLFSNYGLFVCDEFSEYEKQLNLKEKPYDIQESILKHGQADSMKFLFKSINDPDNSLIAKGTGSGKSQSSPDGEDDDDDMEKEDEDNMFSVAAPRRNRSESTTDLFQFIEATKRSTSGGGAGSSIASSGATGGAGKKSSLSGNSADGRISARLAPLLSPQQQPAPPTSSLEGMCGYMDKRGQTNPTWKQRWFVLQKSRLYYYTTHKDQAKNTPISFIELANCCVYMTSAEMRRKGGHVFAVDNLIKVYWMRAPSHNAMTDWVRALKKFSNSRVDNKRIDTLGKMIRGHELEKSRADEEKANQLETLAGTLRSHVGLDHFYKCTEELHTEENLLFWIDAETYRLLCDTDTKKKKKAEEMYYKYIEESSPMEIEVDPKERVVVAEAIVAAGGVIQAKEARMRDDDAQGDSCGGDGSMGSGSSGSGYGAGFAPDLFMSLQQRTCVKLEAVFTEYFKNSTYFHRAVLQMPLTGMSNPLFPHPYRNGLIMRNHLIFPRVSSLENEANGANKQPGLPAAPASPSTGWSRDSDSRQGAKGPADCATESQGTAQGGGTPAMSTTAVTSTLAATVSAGISQPVPSSTAAVAAASTVKLPVSSKSASLSLSSSSSLTGSSSSSSSSSNSTSSTSTSAPKKSSIFDSIDDEGDGDGADVSLSSFLTIKLPTSLAATPAAAPAAHVVSSSSLPSPSLSSSLSLVIPPSSTSSTVSSRGSSSSAAGTTVQKGKSNLFDDLGDDVNIDDVTFLLSSPRKMALKSIPTETLTSSSTSVSASRTTTTAAGTTTTTATTTTIIITTTTTTTTTTITTAAATTTAATTTKTKTSTSSSTRSTSRGGIFDDLGEDVDVDAALT